jgi:hypothetical protein
VFYPAGSEDMKRLRVTIIIVSIAGLAMVLSRDVFSLRQEGEKNVFADIAYSQEVIQRDPFADLLPQDSSGTTINKEPEAIVLPATVITGILWGTDQPRVIINERVYKKGDTIAYPEGEGNVFKIEKNTVLIMYRGKLFQERVTKQ